MSVLLLLLLSDANCQARDESAIGGDSSEYYAQPSVLEVP